MPENPEINQGVLHTSENEMNKSNKGPAKAEDQKPPKRKFKDKDTVIWTEPGVRLECTIVEGQLFDCWWKYRIKMPDGKVHDSWVPQFKLDYG